MGLGKVVTGNLGVSWIRLLEKNGVALRYGFSLPEIIYIKWSIRTRPKAVDVAAAMRHFLEIQHRLVTR